MNQRAVIVVDIQNEYFADGKVPLVGIDRASSNAARIIDAARANGEPVIFIRHERPDPKAPVFTPGSKGVEIHDAVKPLDGESVIVKNFPNAFRGTDLGSRLEAKGIRELVIVGAMSHMCIDATTRAAADLGYANTVIHDACATRDLEFGGTKVPAAQVHAAFMAGLAFAYGTVTSTQEHLAKA